MYSKFLVILIAIVFVSMIFSGIMLQLDIKGAAIFSFIFLLISFVAVLSAPIMMSKLRSEAKGSILSSALKLLIIGFSVNSFFGTMNYTIIAYLVAQHNSVGDFSVFWQLLLLIARSMAFLGFYLIYKSMKEITGYFKGFGDNENRGDSTNSQ